MVCGLHPSRCERLHLVLSVVPFVQCLLHAVCQLPLTELWLTFRNQQMANAEHLMPVTAKLHTLRCLRLDVAHTGLTTCGFQNLLSWALALPHLRELTVNAAHNLVSSVNVPPCEFAARFALRRVRVDLRDNPLCQPTVSFVRSLVDACPHLPDVGVTCR